MARYRGSMRWRSARPDWSPLPLLPVLRSARTRDGGAAPRRRCHDCQHGDRLEPGPGRLRHIAAQGQLIGKEERIEQRGLGALCQILVIAEFGQGQQRRTPMPPRRLVMAAAVNEGLGLYRHRPFLVRAAEDRGLYAM